MRRVLLVLIAVALPASACHRWMQFEPDWLGIPLADTWDLDTAQSVFGSGMRVQSQTRTYTPIDRGERFVLDGVSSEGHRLHAEYTARFDGRDYPLTGLAGVNTVSMQPVTPAEWEAVEKLNGREILRERREVSHDMGTLTVTIVSAQARGDSVVDVLVFVRRSSHVSR